MNTRRAGFTLIEVMVVLSILALVAVLAYNFFGSTASEAKLSYCAQKVHRDLATLSDAYSEYERKNPSTVPPAIIYERLGTPLFMTTFAAELKFDIKADRDCEDKANVNGLYYRFITNADIGHGSAAGDAYSQATAVSEAVCQKYIDLFAPQQGGVIPDWASGAFPDGPTFCFHNTNNNTWYAILLNTVR